MPRSIDPRRAVVIGGLMVLASVSTGCQGEPKWNLAPVEGTVTWDGRPLANMQVVFLADSDAGTVGPRASGVTDAAGHYRLRTDNGDDGAVVGKHRVCVIDWQATPETPPEQKRVPPGYERFLETPLRAEVRPVASGDSRLQAIDFQVP
jgi:hypothetical protein